MTLRSPRHIQIFRSVQFITLLIITLVPLSGDILGMEITQIQINFTPSTYTTAEEEISFRTTEFDS
jgi:hypothetical protein